MIRCAVFDFDGTLVLSNGIKREGFFAVIPGTPDANALMEDLLRDPPGDRYAILGEFAAQFGGDRDGMVADYTRWCSERIVACPERPGAGKAVQALHALSIITHINSATPEAPLREIVSQRYGQGMFSSVRGGHGAKQENLRAVMADGGLAADEIVMIGDGLDDYDAAKAVGCLFIGVAGGTLEASGETDGLIERFDALPAIVRRASKEIPQ